jgi:hypothetical protein
VKVCLKKAKDGRPAVTFVRDDGSSTTGRLGLGDFGPVHDLTHYAVETTLGLPHGFYGLLAAGWNIADFEAKGTAARLPDEAIVAECIVGQLTNVVFGGREVTTTDFNWLVREALVALRPAAAVPTIDNTAFRALRECLAALLDRWRALPPGGTLELDYPA